jgi:hypothetical protein
MKNVTIKIGDREIPLAFTMEEFIEIEENIGNLGEVRDLILKGRQRLRNMVSVIRILGNAGLKKEGQPQDLTDEWLRANMEPHALMAYQTAIMACFMRDGESQAVKEENENKERDLVLEEIRQKKAPVNSHTGE